MKAASHVEVHASYPLEVDPEVSPKERVHIVVREIWQVTGYRFM